MDDFQEKQRLERIKEQESGKVCAACCQKIKWREPTARAKTKSSHRLVYWHMRCREGLDVMNTIDLINSPLPNPVLSAAFASPEAPTEPPKDVPRPDPSRGRELLNAIDRWKQKVEMSEAYNE